MKSADETRAPRARRKRELSSKLLFSFAAAALAGLVGELSVRAYRANQRYPQVDGASFRDRRIDLIRRAFPAQHDPQLGYVPRAGYSGDDNVWRTRVTIRADGLRSNGENARPTGGGAILAVGDSFTFGDQVSDHETWPAQLEVLLQRPVLNAGVFGYGFDQTVLRAEQLLERVDVEQLVCSLIADDLTRCELSRRYTPKPWFAFAGDGLELRGVPVPDTSKDNRLDEQWLRRAMGHSALLDALAWNGAPAWWVGQELEVREHPRGAGLTLGMRLVERLARTCSARDVPLLLVLQAQASELGPARAVHAAELLAHGERLGVATLDLDRRYRALSESDPAFRDEFFAGHMTAAGNRWVAEQIAAALPSK
jgi:hypothetical protein